jgi:DNA-binding NarL/FixJ family response regulator
MNLTSQQQAAATATGKIIVCAAAAGSGKSAVLIERIRWLLQNGTRPEDIAVIAEQKIGRPLLPNEVVHHIDGNKRNNHPDNLLVTNQSDHVRIHHQQMIEARQNKGTQARGETSGMSKLTAAQIVKMREEHKAGKPTKQIATELNVHVGTIQRIISRKSWSHV